MIDLYCERVGPGLWAEPLNALTNLAYLVAALAAWGLMRRVGTFGRPMALLTLTLGAIGIGSGLFHTFATRWAQVLDVGPIVIFQLAFFWLYARKVMNASYASAAMITGFVVIGAAVGRQFPEVLNRSLMYAAAALLLLFFGVSHFIKRKREPFLLLAAFGLFLCALTFRSIDMAVCADFPSGTHFLWHLLTALVLYLGFRSLALNWPEGNRASANITRA